MFAYHSKKLLLSQNSGIHSLAWHSRNGSLAVGGDNGLIKILILNNSHKPYEKKESDGKVPSYTVEGGHEDPIMLLSWNESYRKLTSVDLKGLMIIWKKNGDNWFEEMVNESGSSLINDV